MGDNRLSPSANGCNPCRDLYGIETNRILDACRDRDCFEDVRVFLTDVGEDIIARTGNVRVKSAEITGSYICVEPVQFNRGFYTVDIRLYVNCTCEACVPMAQVQQFEGVAVLEKRVVLFGGETNVSVFRSNCDGNFCAMPEPVTSDSNAPEAVLETVPPIVLGVRVIKRKHKHHCCCCCGDIPERIRDGVHGVLTDGNGDEDGRVLAVSFGLFSVIRLTRPGQLLLNAREYAIPDKECVEAAEEDPCGTFRRIPFPTAEFCPEAVSPVQNGNGPRGGCCGNS